MPCQMTNVPPADAVDIPALRAKYLYERDKRLNEEATAQYERPVGALADFETVDPHTAVTPREPISEDLEIAVLGAGWTGILAGYHLRKLGITEFRNIDHAGDFGGVWYWNRYPGVQCDNDAYCYLPLLEETGHLPKQKFENGYDILDYAQRIARDNGLYEKALFHTTVNEMRWDAAIGRWRIVTDRGDQIRARFVIMANGLLNMPKLPGIPGIDSFKGKMFHTSRWDYGYTGGSCREPALTGLADKRVAIIGTGATSVQAVPFLGAHAKQLYVLQRTPSTIDYRVNTPTDVAWAKGLEPGWQRARIGNFQHAAMERLDRHEDDLIVDIWTEINRNLSVEFEAEGWPELTFQQYLDRREVMDYRVMERLRARVEEMVEDPATAEALKPYYRYLCKRPASNDDFYPTFNRPNVKLIDVSLTRGVSAMTEKGFVANGEEYEIDCMIFASGFEVTSDLDRRWGIDVIEGRDGLSLYDHWREGYKTLHGMTTHGFPNLFFGGGFIQSALNATTTEQMNRHCEHVAFLIEEARKRGADLVEPTAAAQDAWVDHVHETAFDNSAFTNSCTPSYFNGEGDKKKSRWYAGETYGPGWDAFMRLLAEWRGSGDLPGITLKGPALVD